ncbi:DUF2461 domain-containing protein [Plesiocystis pacifica]|uniref:DUF2461 domain-containing protein n=1 Tax=Plesiocystis pacifica TaxID=191768 RepID=UPI0022B5FA35|nr:DUF2461 domain-containing protein [Plesiocystis pacifica]
MLEFFAELSMNNDRDWFEANKARYEEQVREPALAFVRAMGPRLAEISGHFVASDKKVGGSLMRIYRDVRFSKDKTPYKTNLGIQFRHEVGKDVHAPGFYVHMDNEGVFLGAGTWRPESSALAQLRAAIAEDDGAWTAARDDARFREHWRLGGDSLKRPPRGFDAEHPLIEDIKRKDHIAVCDLSIGDLLGPGSVDRIAERFATSAPYVGWLCGVLGVPF